MKAVLNQLDHFQKKIFSIYSNRDYPEKKYLYEKELHELRLKLFSLLLKESHEIELLNHLFEIITALGNLRYRIIDHATFEVCKNELIELSKWLSLSLKNLKMNGNRDEPNQNHFIQLFIDSIDVFEKNYENTLRVITKNPQAFLFFIQNLTALKDVLIELQRVLNDKN